MQLPDGSAQGLLARTSESAKPPLTVSIRTHCCELGVPGVVEKSSAPGDSVKSGGGPAGVAVGTGVGATGVSVGSGTGVQVGAGVTVAVGAAVFVGVGGTGVLVGVGGIGVRVGVFVGVGAV